MESNKGPGHMSVSTPGGKHRCSKLLGGKHCDNRINYISLWLEVKVPMGKTKMAPLQKEMFCSWSTWLMGSV